MRLQVFLAKAGIASRRKCEELIKAGRVSVNEHIILDMGFKVDEKDVISLDDKKVAIESRKIYIALNKPIGYVTTVKDQFLRKTVIDLVKEIPERIYPVGRLDYDTSGLLLLSNDGDFTYKLTHPKHKVEKTYIVELAETLTLEQMNQFQKGIKIDNYITAPAKLECINQGKNYSQWKVTIHEGKNRQVRKMFLYFGYKVLTLKRISIGNIVLGDLAEGKWRYIKQEEISKLIRFID